MPDLNYCGITAELLRNYCGITVKQAELLYARKNSPCVLVAGRWIVIFYPAITVELEEDAQGTEY